MGPRSVLRCSFVGLVGHIVIDKHIIAHLVENDALVFYLLRVINLIVALGVVEVLRVVLCSFMDQVQA